MSEPPVSATTRPRWARILLLWAAGLAAAVWGGIWVRQELAARGQREGQSAVARAARLASDAREAEAAGDLISAAKGSREAVELLRRTEGVRGGAPYAAALVDLASRLARRPPPEALSAAAALLEEAWELPDLSPILQGRIARDRGAIELLRGDPAAAERWYEMAQEAEGKPSPRLETLRESGAWRGPNGR